MNKVHIEHSGEPIDVQLKIGGSKSISNRVLIMNALGDQPAEIHNLSDSDDSQTLVRLLGKFRNGKTDPYDAHHAGTTFRFMTAFLAIQAGTQILTGSDRMKQRPVGALVKALRELGAEINYLENEGYPPLSIGSFGGQKSSSISIRSDISSQFISALCMIAPALENGLIIHFEGDPVSGPYIQMTLDLMQAFGIESETIDHGLHIPHQSYDTKDYTVESDWSSASYHYAIAAIAKDARISLNYFKRDSLQADAEIQSFCSQFGVQSTLVNNQLDIRSTNKYVAEMQHDFLSHPDIAQTVSAICAANNIKIDYKGLKTLFIKETDRVGALTKELSKVGVAMVLSQKADYEYSQSGLLSIAMPEFETYQDHRMAMCLAPLALLSPIEIKNPKVVDKSYPNFWKDLVTLGFKLTFS